MHVNQWIKIPLEGVDEVTLAEILHFLERKLDESDKIKGRIAKDLRRIGEWAFLNPSAYDQLRAKYKKRGWTSRKKISILDDMQKEACQCAS